MTAGMCCALRPSGGIRQRPPLPLAQSPMKPPRSQRAEGRKCGGTQHTPAASLGAVGQHGSSHTAKNTHCQELCCVYV